MKILLIFLLTPYFAISQCKDGFVWSEINGKRVKVPCINHKEISNCSLTITKTTFDKDSTDYIDFTFYNPTDSLKIFYLYDFEKTQGVPLSFEFIIKDANTSETVWSGDYSKYMDNSVFFNQPRYNTEKYIKPRDKYMQTIQINWPYKEAGDYEIILLYDKLKSNTLNFVVKK